MGMSHTDILTEPVLEIACSSCQHPLDVSGLPAFTEIACPECHAPQTVPTRLGPFLLVELLGKGGMGAVYRGRDTSLDRWVAIKVMLSTLGENQEFVDTFRREAQAAAALNHPNIVQIYSYGVAQGQPYIVMELLEGGRLDQMIAKGEPLSEALVLKIGADVAEGLNTAAGIGLIHGDVKPENILLDTNGIAKVVDFGLARFKQSKEPSVKGIWGTPYYIAPEKIRGQPSDARSDIYSLGGTLFHALALKPPFDGETPIDVVKARLTQSAPLLRTLRPDANPEIEAIIARMLDADLLRRYPTYMSLLADMRKALATVKPQPTSSFGQVSKRGGKIILTRKKSGGTVSTIAPSPSSSSPLPIRISPAGAAPAAPVATPNVDAKPRMRKGVKIALIAGLGTLALALTIGGIVWGVMHHKRVKAEQAAADALRARLNTVRAATEAVWNELVSASGSASKHADTVKPWQADSETAVSAVMTLTNKLTDATLIAEVETNAPAMSQLVSLVVTGTFHDLALQLQSLTNAAGTNRVAILASTNAPAAEQMLSTITNLPAQALTIQQSMAAELEKGAGAYKSLMALKKRVSSAAAEQEAAAEQAMKEKAEAEKKAREEAEAQRQAAAREREVQAEKDRVEALRKANSGAIQQNQFKQAQGTLPALEKEFKTDAGKEAYKHAVERYRLLVELKAFIIAGVAAEVKANPGTGYKFGWLNSKDILGADENNVIIRGGSIPWEQVPPSQMLRFIRHYAADPELPRREAARQSLAGAIYVFEAGAGSESAQKVASEFVGEAVRASASIEAQAKALLPELAGAK